MSSPVSIHNGEREKKNAALGSALAAVGLTAIKLVAGFLTGSLGILAEAAHSALDLVAAAMTLFAVRISDKPADGHHLYGHGKVENLSALFDQDLSVGKKRMFPSAGLAEIIVPEALVQRKKSSVSSR